MVKPQAAHEDAQLLPKSIQHKVAGRASAQTKADLQVRDILRGLRYAVKKSGDLLADPAHQVLPLPLTDLTDLAFKKLDHLSGEMERASSAIGGPFQKSSTPDKNFFSTEGFRFKEGNINAAESASVLYFGLRYAFQQLNGYDVLVSELQCLECIEEFSTHEFSTPDAGENADKDTESAADSAAVHASRLFKLIQEKELFRRQPLKLNHDKSLAVNINAASFAAVLWFFVPRDLDSMDEQNLLDICCEVTQSNLADINNLIHQVEPSQRLFERLLNMI